MDQTAPNENSAPVEKVPTGILGFDEIAHGGIPQGRTSLLAGTSGSGKTVFAVQFLINGIINHGENGVFVTFEETPEDIIKNMRSFGWDLQKWIDEGKLLFVDASPLEDEVIEVGKFDLGAFLARIFNAINKVGAERVAIDSTSALFPRYHEQGIIRRELYRITAKLKKEGVTSILTAEKVNGERDHITRFGVEEFVSDNVILLHNNFDPRRNDRKRSVEILKFRGTTHDSHPTTFRIAKGGIVIFPRLTVELVYHVSDKRVSTGIIGMDTMTGGGFFEGSTVLLTGSSGTGKTVMALQFLVSRLTNSEKCVFVSFEESRDQLMRNAKGFGWDLEKYEKEGLLKILVAYPEQRYLEEHIETITEETDKFGAKTVVIDSLSSLGNVFSEEILRDFVSRLNAYLKSKLITTLFTNATTTLLGATQITDAHLSTITDHIIMLRYVEIKSELRHAVLILKMRGSQHDKKLRELTFTPQGLHLTNEFKGFEGVLSGITRKVSGSIEEQLHDLFVEFMGPMGEKIFVEEKVKGLTTDSVNQLIKQLGDQGIVSKNRKAEFVDRAKNIFGKAGNNTSNKEGGEK